MKKKLNIIAVLIVSVGMLSMVGTNEMVKDLASVSYKVIKVNGKIVFVKTKSNMKQGDMYVDGTPITFANNESRAAIINRLKGRCVLSPAKKGQPKILPAANNISSRSGALLNKIDLQNHFTGQYLVIGKMSLDIGELSYPQNDKNFFYLVYNYDGETIRKQLAHDGKSLILDVEEIFKIDGESVEVKSLEMGLYYMDNGTGEIISTFTPVFPNLDNLKSEVEIIMGEYTDEAGENKLKEVTAYLNEFYGKPHKDNLVKWLDSEFKM